MLDFHRRGRRVPNYLGRREQYKLLALVLTMGLVVLLMTKARDPNGLPKILEFLTRPAVGGPAGGGAAAHGAKPDERRGDLAAIDTRLTRPARPELGPDEFVATAEPQEPLAEGKQFFPGVRADLLAKVQDDTPFRAAESDAYYHLLDVLAKHEPQELERASLGPVTFTQLFTQPKVYRGELVTIKGEVWSAVVRRPPRNDYGISSYYKVCIKPDDRAELVIAYLLELGNDFPLGEELRVPVEFTGFFYKRMPYQAGDGIRVAPVLLARGVTRRLPAADPGPPRAEPFDVKRLAVAAVAAACFSLAVVGFVLTRTRRVEPSASAARRRALTSQRPFEPFEPPPSDETIREQLRHLAQREGAQSDGAQKDGAQSHGAQSHGE